MKKNAILVAAILFVSAVANSRAQSGYSDDYSDLNARGRTIQNTENINRTPQGAPAPSEMATSSQYDPASVNRFRADSSVRGGSNEARGLRNYGRTDYDTSSRPMNPAVKADSSVRGGSWEARNRDWNGDRMEPSTGGSGQGRIKADSSIRGGSNEARGYDRRNWQSSTSDSSSSDLNSRSDDDGELYLFFFTPEESQGGAGQYDSGSASNWNPSDDLMKDNEQSQGLTDHEQGLLEQDRQQRSDMLDDMDSHTGASAQYETGNDSMPKGGLNSSRNLEKDITGEYNLEDRVDTSNPDQPSTGQLSPVKSASQIQAEHADQNSQGAFDSSFNSSRSTDIAHGANSSLGTEAGVTSESDEAVGGPGSTEVGTSNSSSEEHSISEDIKASERSETGVPGRSSITTDSQDYLFKNNRAQGVGSAATGEFGVANSGQSTAAGMSDDALADKVKNALVKESTGTFGVTKPEARNIQVTAHDGVVTLKGSVPNERDRKMVEVHVAEISGVRRVDNQLTVSPSANPANRDLNSGSNLEDQTDELQR